MMPLARYGSVYRITCRTNGKVYIGLTRSYVSDRWYQHKKAAASDISSPLYYAIKKHGIENFYIKSIASAISDDALPELERHLIAQHNSYGNGGYNRSLGGERHISRRMSEEGKRRLRAARNRPDSIENNRAAQKAFMATPEGRARQQNMVMAARLAKPKLCASRRAYAATNEGILQLSAASKLGAIRSKELHSKRVIVDGKEYCSVRDAAEQFGIERGAVRFRIKSPNFAWYWAA